MDWQTALYRISSYLKHCLTARNTGGYGIHSPYLFELVRMVLHDENVYYAWEEIEKVRARMLADEREVEFVDYGSGKRRLGDEAKGTELPIALGVIRNVEEETYDSAVNQQIEQVREHSKVKTFDQLTSTLEQWEV